MKNNRGFSLIEVLISIFIISVLVVMLQAVLSSSALVTASKNQGIALSIARNELENLRTNGYGALPESGSFSDDLISTLPEGSATLIVTDYNDETKRVVVQVSWEDPRSAVSRTVSLETLITQVGGLP